MNLSEFRTRKTWGAPGRLLVDAPRDLGSEAMDDARPTQTRFLVRERRDYVTILTILCVIEADVSAMP